MKLTKIKEGKSQYKTVAHLLHNWLRYSMAPGNKEQEWSISLASSISMRISRYCWPEARELDKQWKEILKLQEQYSKGANQGLSQDELILLHNNIHTRTCDLIDSFINLHNRLHTSAPPPVEGEWSKPASKKELMVAVGINSYKKFNAFAKCYGIKQAGNRKLWQIRLDSMDQQTRSKLEKLG